MVGAYRLQMQLVLIGVFSLRVGDCVLRLWVGVAFVDGSQL
jgi:hypothetical protein